MKGRIRIATAVVVALSATACAEAEDTGATSATEEQSTVALEPADGAAPAGEAAGASLAVDSLDGRAYLTDAAGRALYLIEGAPQDSATCYDACAEEWPPFLSSDGAPRVAAQAGAAVQADMLGTITRRDGATQVTYGGNALYYYHDDTGPGMTSGQDVTDQWGEWYLVQPDGQPLETHE